MRCPNCGSENVNLIYNTSKRGFKGSDACCGYILLGPLGLLCGALGSGKKDTNEFWLCNNCGSRFQNKDIVKYNQNMQNGYIDSKPFEKESVEPNEIIEQPVLPDNLASKEDLCAPKIVFNKAEPYSGGLSIESLLKRAALFLEDREWEKAYEYSENAIDIDACCAEAYLFKFMAEYNISIEENIPSECFYMMKQIDSLTELENYKKAYRFGNEEMKLKLEKYSNQAVYNYADELAKSAYSAKEYLNAAEFFEKISEYSDSAKRAENCREKIRLDKYSHAIKTMNSAENTEELNWAKIAFDELGDYKDSKQKAVECEEKCKEIKYNSACKILDSAESDKDVDIAENMFRKLEDYKDSKKKAESCPNKKIEIKYNNACHIIETAQSATEIRCAQSLLEEIKDYKDAAEKVAGCDKLCDDFNYDEACKILENAKRIKDIDKAVDLFNQVHDHDSLNERLEECGKKRIEIQNNFNKLLKISLICAGALILAIVLVLIISSIASNSEDKETAENTEEIISETETEITTVSVANETTIITSSESVTTKVSETSETTVTETTGQVRKNVSNKKETFNFNGGHIDYTEYTYYNSDPDFPEEYINFSATIKLDDYPNSEDEINNVLAEIGNAPTAEILLNSRAPKIVGYGMMAEHNQLRSVYAENTLLFITTYYLWDGGGGTSMSIMGYDTSYVFDLKTGKQLSGTQLFNDLESVKKLVIDYADNYIKENIHYEDYADQPYYEQLVNSEWYNGSWTYDGTKFTVLYMYLLPGYMYKNIYVEIPAEVIKPYFAYGSEYAINISSELSPLSDFEYGYNTAYKTSFWIINYNGNDNIIVIPDEIDNLPVVEIAPRAFSSCRANTVIIPDSVTLMSPLAFENSLCDVIYKGKTYLPNQYNDLCDAVNNAETQTAVGYDFKYTEYDREITLNKYIGNDTTIIIPNKINGKPVTCIADAFAYTNVKEVIIPEGVCVLMNGTFACCYNLESITLPSTIYAITGQVFYNCSNLTNIDIPNNLEMNLSISTDSIVGCPGLANFDFPNNISWYELTYGIS